MAESLKKRFKVSWADPSDPTLGYRCVSIQDATAMLWRDARCSALADCVPLLVILLESYFAVSRPFRHS